MNASMEWKLAFHETDSMLDYEIRNGLYMAINYSDSDKIQFKGTEEHLQSMGFIQVGELGAFSMELAIDYVSLPCYKGKINLPNGENVDIIICINNYDTNATLGFPYTAFEKILIDLNKREVTLSINIAKLKSLIEKSNKKYMEELENRIDLEDLWKDFKIVVN